MAAADDDHRVVGGRLVEIVAERQPRLGELSLVPVAVRDHEPAGLGVGGAGGDGLFQLGQRAHAGEIHAGAAAEGVEVVVGEAGDHGPPVEGDGLGLGPAAAQDFVVGADRGDPVSGDGERFDHAVRVVEGVDASAVEDEVGGRRRFAAEQSADREPGGGERRGSARHQSARTRPQ